VAGLKQKKKQRAVLDSVFWFVVGGGLVFGVLLLLLILVQNGDLSSQLAASVPSGSPTTSSAPIGACYTSEGCTVATGRECHKWGGAECKYYWIKDKGCLKEGTYQFKSAYAKRIGFTKSFYEAMKTGCLLAVQKLIQCPSGQIKAYPGPVAFTCLNPKEWPFPTPMVTAIPIEVGCSAVGVCVPDPSPSLSPAPS